MAVILLLLSFISFLFHVVENNGDRGRLSFERTNIMVDFKKIPRSDCTK